MSPHPSTGASIFLLEVKGLVHVMAPEVDLGPHGLHEGVTDEAAVPGGSWGLKGTISGALQSSFESPGKFSESLGPRHKVNLTVPIKADQSSPCMPPDARQQ